MRRAAGRGPTKQIKRTFFVFRPAKLSKSAGDVDHKDQLAGAAALNCDQIFGAGRTAAASPRRFARRPITRKCRTGKIFVKKNEDLFTEEEDWGKTKAPFEDCRRACVLNWRRPGAAARFVEIFTKYLQKQSCLLQTYTRDKTIERFIDMIED